MSIKLSEILRTILIEQKSFVGTLLKISNAISENAGDVDFEKDSEKEIYTYKNPPLQIILDNTLPNQIKLSIGHYYTNDAQQARIADLLKGHFNLEQTMGAINKESI